ncbi:MAG: iron-containing alcohol dehydrogenase [Christensenellales bacterium]
MEPFYNNIIYQKNAIREFGNYLSQNFFKKRVLCVFSSQAKKDHLSQIVNKLNKAGCVFSTLTLDRTPFISRQMIAEIYSSKSRAYDLVVGIGGGACSDATKLLAKKYFCQSVFVASSFSNMSMFNPFVVIENGEKVEFDYAFAHSKVFIDEGWVKNFDSKKFEQTEMFLCSLATMVDDLYFYKMIFGQNTPFDLEELKQTIIQMKNELAEIKNEDEKNLKLQDYVIEISYILRDSQIEYLHLIKMANLLSRLLIKKHTQKSFGELCYISSLTMQKFYYEFYQIKHIQLFEPYVPSDLQKLSNKFSMKRTSFKNVENEYYYHKNKLFFQKINAVKQNLAKNSLVTKNNILNFENFMVESYLCGEDLYDLFKALSLAYDSGMVVGLIKRTGLLNA